MQDQFTFGEYLDERSKKDTKFVSLKDSESDENPNQVEKKAESEFSMSDEYDQEDPHTDVSNSKKKWNREMAEEWYANTKTEIENRLHGDYLIPVPEEGIEPL
jgi:hypothetical protein